MEPMIFCDGMTFETRKENAPEVVRGGIHFNVTKFTDFLQKNKNEKGWVRVKMMKSKEKGSIYFILDTWKPKSAIDPDTGDIIPPDLGKPAIHTIDDIMSVDVENIPF